MNVFISYPRSGRAWTKLMLKRLAQEGIVQCDRIKHSHDTANDYTISQYRADKRRWRGHRIVLVTRDPRDIVVSHWHLLKFRTKRFHEKWGDMSLFEWIQQPEGLAFPIRFLNDWANSGVDHFRISYEEMKRDVVSTMTKAMRHWGIPTRGRNIGIAAKVTPDAVRRNWPHSNNSKDIRVNSVRRAESGVWREYFTDKQIEWIMSKVQELDSGYKEYRT